MNKKPTMKDAIDAGNRTLHGAIDYWQKRALDAETTLEAFECADETTRKLANNYIEMTCATKRPYAQPEAGRKNVYMDRDTLRRLKDIGDGNVSAGIRIAAKAYKGMEVK